VKHPRSTITLAPLSAMMTAAPSATAIDWDHQYPDQNLRGKRIRIEVDNVKRRASVRRGAARAIPLQTNLAWSKPLQAKPRCVGGSFDSIVGVCRAIFSLLPTIQPNLRGLPPTRPEEIPMPTARKHRRVPMLMAPTRIMIAAILGLLPGAVASTEPAPPPTPAVVSAPPGDSAPIPNTAGSAVAQDIPAPAGQMNPPAASSGLRAYIDPWSGELIPTPAPGTDLRPMPQSAVSTPGPSLRQVVLPDGSIMVDLQGQFRSNVTATVGADGEMTIEHQPPATLDITPADPTTGE
jgi:hypothetical protein